MKLQLEGKIRIAGSKDFVRIGFYNLSGYKIKKFKEESDLLDLCYSENFCLRLNIDEIICTKPHLSKP